jgi:hypothetical protein
VRPAGDEQRLLALSSELAAAADVFLPVEIALAAAAECQPHPSLVIGLDLRSFR